LRGKGGKIGCGLKGKWVEPRLEGCGGCLGFSQGEGKGFGWLEEGTTGDGCRPRESGRRWWNRPGEGRRRW